ncbi:MAG: TonB-dependent receptor plug domain-containing protein [Bacteroidetes bacterium]|nr:TonB-dependent receptor plug domain-containing protein [Bacteroidota bacterium]
MTINLKNRNIKEILKHLQGKAKVSFNYKSSIFTNEPLTEFTAENEKLSEILIKLLKPYNVEFKYFGGNSIILKPIKKRNSQYFTISGYVFDQTSGEKLIGASVYCHYNKRGTYTNDLGFFTLILPNDSIFLEVKYVGYKNISEKSYNRANTFRFFKLEPHTNLKEIEVTDEKQSKFEQKPNSIFYNLRAIKDLPAFMGEPDVLRAVQILPGVQSSGESAGGLNVRGGGSDQNLVLIDGVPVYNIVHVFGLFSIINPVAVNSVELIKGGFSAKYNGRLSSILDIKLKDGNYYKLAGNVNIGMFLSSITLQGPLVKNKSSFIASFRRTYFDAFYQPFQYFSNRKSLKNYSGWYYFYDIVAKANYKIGNRDKITISFFRGIDRGKISEKQIFSDTVENLLKHEHNKQLRWNTLMSNLRWDRVLTDKIFMVNTAGITKYDTKFEDEILWETKPKPEQDFSHVKYTQTSGNTDYFFNSVFEINSFIKHKIVTGVELIYHDFNTGTLDYSTIFNKNEYDTSLGKKNIYSFEKILFIEDNWKISPRLFLNCGMSINSIAVKNKEYLKIQPRLSLNFAFSKKAFINVSYTKMQQNLQVLPNNGVGLPIDIWIPVTEKLKPQLSEQSTIGIFYSVNRHYRLSLESYIKFMQNLVEIKEGEYFVFGGFEWDNSFYTGKGFSRGVEIMIEKQTGKVRGWLGYSLSKSERIFENINNGKSFPFKYDRRHQISAFMKFPLTKKKWNASLSWIYTTGSPITVPSSVYKIDNKIYYEFTDRNNERMTAYHRMDVSISKSKIYKNRKRTLNFGAYNIYSHLNPVFVSTNYLLSSDKSKLTFYEVGLLPIIPYISYEISF